MLWAGALPNLQRTFITDNIRNPGDSSRAGTQEEPMADHVYKHIELTGTSPKGIEEAVQNALARAGKTVRNMRWFTVTETRGYIENNAVAHWQVTLKIGFTLDD